MKKGIPSSKHPKRDSDGNKLRNGYSDGSHSEIEVSANESWGPEEIRNRGLKLLKFLEKRWEVRIKEEEREKLLFLNFGQESQPEDQQTAVPYSVE